MFFICLRHILQKRGKRRWIFRKPFCQEMVTQVCEERTITNKAEITSSSTNNIAATSSNSNPFAEAADTEQRHAIAVAMATTAAAQAAVATAQAAVEVVRLARPSIFVREKQYAALVIQTAFRGYLVIIY